MRDREETIRESLELLHHIHTILAGPALFENTKPVRTRFRQIQTEVGIIIKKLEKELPRLENERARRKG